MSRFTVQHLPLAGLTRITRQFLGDSRGFLSRVFCSDELADIGWIQPVAQINHTYSAQAGTVRGLHFQHPPYSEIKLVTCLRGKIWDVAVDLRAGSETFLNWHAEELSAENGHSLLIPKGFAHGFQTLSDDVDLLYCHSEPYTRDAEAGLNPQDIKLAIDWPLTITEISKRDTLHPMLNSQFAGLNL